MPHDTAIGIACGLAAALCHSVSYLFSRRAVAHTPQEGVDRFIGSHLIMGFVALCFLPFALHLPLPPMRQLAPALAWTSGFYILGQACFFVLNRYVSPSLSSPLLGIKILVVATLSVALLHRPVPMLQWLAGGLAVIATYTLNASAGKLPAKALLWLVAACCGYAMSDTGIAHLGDVLRPPLVDALGSRASLATPLVGVCLTYTVCGAAAVLATAVRRRPVLRKPIPTIGFAVTWLGAMVFLFTSIALAGLVTAIILQAMRGLFSFILAHALPRLGIDAAEDGAKPPSALRLAGALLMVAAAALAALATR